MRLAPAPILVRTPSRTGLRLGTLATYGIDAEFVGGFRGRRPRAAERLAGVLEACRPVADALGCLAELESAAELAESPGHARQRVRAADRGLVGLVAELSAEYAPAPSSARLS